MDILGLPYLLEWVVQSIGKYPEARPQGIAMRFDRILSLLPAFALPSAASPPRGQTKIPSRPDLKPAPFDTGSAFPCSLPRDHRKRCVVKPGIKEDRDDASRIKAALKECNNGGTIILDQSYQIRSPLDLTFLKHVDVVITGEIHFVAERREDVYYWAESSFKYEFQNQSVYWKWGGKDVNIYGDLSNELSVLDGHGQQFWEEIRTNKSVSAFTHSRLIAETRPCVLSYGGQCSSHLMV